MKSVIFMLLAICTLVACKNQSKKDFSVTGKIIHATGKTVFLEAVPIGTMQPAVVDSALLGKDGSFSLKTPMGEASMYNIRIDNNEYPLASVINDAPEVELQITMDKNNKQFAEKYEVKGSEASQQMKDFITTFNTRLQSMYTIAKEVDSLRNGQTPDSMLNTKMQSLAAMGTEVKTFAVNEIKKASNPALVLFELGYYQSTASNAGFGLSAISSEEVTGIMEALVKKNPNHTGIAAIQQTLQKKLTEGDAASNESMWVGKQAPDFTLPDVDGKPLALSSLKGKYVLVDFWASWCGPCRLENPNVVAAYNKFKNKNFTILGVSLDEDKSEWIAAIQKDQLTWLHSSDLKGWQSAVLPLYRFEGIPYNVLLDPQGKVIAEGLRGADLEAKLASVLK